MRGVIENMSWFTGDDGKRYEIFGSGGGQALADELGVPLLGQVPLVPALREGGDVGVPVTVTDPAARRPGPSTPWPSGSRPWAPAASTTPSSRSADQGPSGLLSGVTQRPERPPERDQ